MRLLARGEYSKGEKWQVCGVTVVNSSNVRCQMCLNTTLSSYVHICVRVCVCSVLKYEYKIIK